MGDVVGYNPAPDPKVETQVHEKRDDFLAEAIALAVEKYLKPTIDVNRVQEIINETLTKFDVVDKMKEVEKYLNDRASVIERELMDRLLNLAPIKVQALDGTVRDVGLQHKMFEPILKLISQRQNVWMVGPSGSGKTHLAESVAKSLGLSFEAISVGLQTSKSDLFGYTDAHGTFVETGFFRCYKNGGVFLLDEVDNGNANVLAMFNAATSLADPEAAPAGPAEGYCVPAAVAVGIALAPVFASMGRFNRRVWHDRA